MKIFRKILSSDLFYQTVSEKRVEFSIGGFFGLIFP
jgi:hypothetical protein